MSALLHVQSEPTQDHPWNSASSMLQERMERVCSEAADVCVADYESADVSQVTAVVDRARALVTKALEVLDVVSVLYDGGNEHFTFELEGEAEGDSAGSSAPSDGEGIGDAVMLARMGLRSRQRTLLSLGESAPRWERLAAAGSALRTIQKSLSAVDRCMADFEHVPASINFYHRVVERSLDIRRRYVRFCHTVVGAPPAELNALRARARSIGNAIAHLLGRDVAVHLRTGDRALLMMEHAKVREWLVDRSEHPEHIAAGQRLIQDMNNIATMFLDVNKREELVQHDARLVREVLRDHRAAIDGGDEAARKAVLARLSTMLGRSPSLDAALSRPWGEGSAEELWAVLVDLDRTLGAAAGVTDEEGPSSGRRTVRR